MMRTRDVDIATVLACSAAFAGLSQPSFAQENSGVFVIEVAYETRSEGDTSTSSSSGRNTYEERIIEKTADCTVKRFDLHDDGPTERPLSEWQWPVEVERCADGEMQLMNKAEMEARRDNFLASAKIPKEACGSHIFTWNVFKIECDPLAILETLNEIDLGSLDLTEGASYTHSESEVPLALAEGNAESLHLAASLAVDEDAFHEAEAQTMIVVGGIMGEPVSEEVAAAKAQTIKVSGTTEITFTIGDDGAITRVVVTEAEVDDPEQGTETRYAKTTTHRKRAEP